MDFFGIANIGQKIYIFGSVCFFFIAILKTIGRPEVPSGFVFCLFNDTLDYFINKLEVENKK
jgi:hypothetical protein